MWQDSKGFIWAGTADGLNRYDGYEFIIYRTNPDDHNSIGSNDISCIYENPNDSTLFIGTQNAGLFIYNRNDDEFVHIKSKEYQQGNKSVPKYITSIIANHEGKLLVATQNNGLFNFDPADSSLVKIELTDENQIGNILCLKNDNEGNLWIGTSNGLFHCNINDQQNEENPVKFEIVKEIPNNRITALSVDIKGYLWVGSANNGLFIFHPVSKTVINHKQKEGSSTLQSNQINDIVLDSDGMVCWIGTNRGLHKYDRKKNEFYVFQNIKNDPESISNNNIYCLLKDKSGILWIGTYAGGLNKLDHFRNRFPKYQNIQTNDGKLYQAKDIHNIHVDKKNQIWITTSQGLFEVSPLSINPSSSLIKNATLHLGNAFAAVTSVNNGILVNSHGKILKLDTLGRVSDFTEKIKKKTNVIINSFPTSFKDENDKLWLAIYNGLLAIDEKNDIYTFYVPKHPGGEQIPFAPSAIFSDHRGRLWIGTYNAQLFTLDVHSGVFNLVYEGHSSSNISFNKIFSICEPVQNHIWYGTDRGLIHLDTENGTTERYLDTDGLSNNFVYAVISDDEQKIWCSTNHGISCFDTNSRTFQNYTPEDGLQGYEYNEGAFFKDLDGKIYLGGLEGIDIFDPKEISTNPFIPQVVITGMEIQYKKVSPETHPKITDKQISELQELTLNYKQNAFSFEFTALSYSLPNRNQYQYALTSNGDKDLWINSGNRRRATYTNVPPGSYTFKVKASNSDGIWNTNPTSIDITIKPPYWQRWWFRIFLFTTLAGLTYLLIYLRIRDIHKQKKRFKKLVKLKTKALQEQTKKVESQNNELKVINKDISDKNQQLKEQHLQILEQRDSLLKMAEKVERISQARIQFFTGISHELRTPLTLVVSPLKNLIENISITTEGELKRKLTNIYINASKLLLIVNQLLDFRKAETEYMEMRVSKFNLVTFIHKTSMLFNELAKQKNIMFQFSSQAENIEIWADTDKLEKIIYNILSNAFKFTNKKGNIVVRISRSKANTEAVITITDNGVGISEKELPHIFERFYQQKETETFQNSGSGLGLALVAKYIELHKGNIEVTSSLGSGSKFVLTLPIGNKHFDDKVIFNDRDQNAEQIELLSATIGDYIPVIDLNSEKEKDIAKNTLLIIEDDYNLRSYLKEILSSKYVIEDAENAANGLKLAESKNPSVVICDVMLPDSSGYEVCKTLKSSFNTSHLPVIILTSLADKENQLNSLEAGADDFITKPFDLKHLLLSVENLIAGRKRLQKKYSLIDPDNLNKVVTNTKDQIFLQEAIKSIEKNLNNTSFNVESFCEEMQLSQPQCYRKIKAITGFNISEFIRNTRLKKASKLLLSGEYKINEIAYETGFNDPNYFTRCFTRLFGLTPSDYLKSEGGKDMDTNSKNLDE